MTIRFDTLLALTDRVEQLVGDGLWQEASAAEAEREAIIRAGWACKGRVTEMARELKIGRTTLWRKMKVHQIDPARFRNGR